jgi:hypothetical protein
MHGDWFEEQDNIKDWIEKSQNHQAFATKIMCDALRRRSDLVVSTAIHLLIDVWPSGWMKTLVGVDRIPKKAYFEFKKSMEPLRINLRCDRWKAYEEEAVDVEAWILNDRWDNIENLKIVATLRDEYMEYQSYEIVCKAKSVSASIAGVIPLKLPKVKGRKKIYLDADLLKEDGKCLNSETFCIEVFEKANYSFTKKSFSWEIRLKNW